MSHGFELKPAIAGVDPDTPALLQPLARLLHLVNQAMVALGMVALLVASCVLTYSVVSRYVMRASTDWQDEAAVFCLVGATFLCGAFVQQLRGHVGIEAMAGLLPRSLNRLRLALVDLMCTAFCSFFAWKSWTLFHEAWAEGQTTSSSWAPPLWIPYGLMGLGMTLLSLQLAVQLAARLNGLFKAAAPVGATAHGTEAPR
ncbi:TRAP transporter small permease [Pelomonas sp. P7]|uniref:TRAP transporter small permease protein n=1 Tax=Pelomonas caseinilytica TaxID=2906763 RepID=A0ABS8XND5_9BURK|nr:TRAP transporter small permease [Pelomonas sp. P7]MCE4540402.1 TRAP transporter small permease [Pelomonas sp. P7]